MTTGNDTADVVGEVLPRMSKRARLVQEVNECHDLFRREGIGRILRIGKLFAPVLGNRVQALLWQIFQKCADRDFIPHMPPFPREPVGGEESAGTRVLSEAEIKKQWAGLDSLSTGDEPKLLRPLALALKLCLITAARRGEVAAARFDDIDEAGVWCIPITYKRKAKSNVPRFVPLSPLALSVVEELRTLADGSPFWLPNTRTEKIAVDRARSISKAARIARKELKMKSWRPHDLRRSARTHMARLKITAEVADRVLGHAYEKPMQEVYNQHPYADEMRIALDKWGAELERIIA